MQLTKEEVQKYLRQNIHDDEKKELDYETSWAVLNGLVISYLKAKGEFNKTKEENLKEGVKKVLLSLPKYAFGFNTQFKLNQEDKSYFALCPADLVEGLTYKDINEDKVIELAQKVIEISAENGIHEEGKMTIPDKKVSEASMGEFMEIDKTMEIMYDQILATRGETGLAVAIDFYKEKAKQAVKDEVDFHADITNYVVKFYSTILLHAKDEEESGASI